MDCRTPLGLGSLLSVMLGLTGCGAAPQHAQFRNAFLPPPPRQLQTVELAPPPVIQPNIYLKDTAPLLLSNPAPVLRTRGDDLVENAERHFQRGRRLYQNQDYEGARREFDAAIDLMLDAAAQRPADREKFERRFDEMVDSIHLHDLSGLGAAGSPEEERFAQAPLEDILQMTFPVDPGLKDKVKEQLAATVSQLPLSTNEAVLGYIQYFSGNGRHTMIAGLQRAGRYRPMISRILQEEGVPQELIHLAQAESGFYSRAVSRMAAAGMWQFVAWRGNEYGLKQTGQIDERLDPEKATRAAARHLRDLYHQFGDWYLAIAAYNCGPNGVSSAVERTGYADFWELRKRGVIPIETTNYVPIILAMTIMEKNAAQYGLDSIIPDSPREYDRLEMTVPTNLALISDLTETPVAELIELNPAVLSPVVPAKYVVNVPKNSAGALLAGLERVPEERRGAWRMHRVAAGETLAAIGKRYDLAAAKIASVNHLTAAGPAEGDQLLIPAAPPAPRRAVVARRTGSRSGVQRAAARRPAVPLRRPATSLRSGSGNRASLR